MEKHFYVTSLGFTIESESLNPLNVEFHLKLTHSVRCMHAVVRKAHGYRSWNFEKSSIFNLRFQKVCLQCRLYLKLRFQGINSHLDPSGGQKNSVPDPLAISTEVLKKLILALQYR